MAYASSRHAVRRLAAEAARGARARAAAAPTGRAIPRASLDAPLSRPPAWTVPSRGFAGASSASPAAATAGAGSAGSAGWRSWLGAAFLLSPSAVCVALCKWQLDRWEWKKGELQAREKALAEGERLLADVRAAARRGEPVEEYTAVRVEGTLQCERSVRIAPRVRSVHGSPMPGALLITAVRPRGADPVNGSRLSRRRSSAEKSAAADAAVVLVNRGWVPEGWREPEGGACLRATGVTRASETPGVFTPANDPATRRFHWVDVPAIAASLGLPADTPLVQLTRGGERDRGNAAPTSFPAPAALADLRAFKVAPEDHVNYAATWGGLALATGGGALYALAGRGKGAAGAARRAAAAARVVR